MTPGWPGFLVVDKAAGETSFDVVRTVRRLLGVKRVGHAGTLDPLATGVLPVAVGSATRLVALVQAGRKVYRARVRLGITTTTADAEGAVTAERPVTCERGAVEAALHGFVGRIQQRPPAFSALKVGGVPAYTLARRGETPQLAARTIDIHRITLLAYAAPLADLEIECGSGTYIRSLAVDLGEALGCGAHLAGLVRTRVGACRLEAATGSEILAGMGRAEGWGLVRSPLDVVEGLTAVDVTPADERLLRDGAVIAGTAGGEHALALGSGGRPIGWLAAAADGWRPLKIFPETRLDDQPA